MLTDKEIHQVASSTIHSFADLKELHDLLPEDKQTISGLSSLAKLPYPISNIVDFIRAENIKKYGTPDGSISKPIKPFGIVRNGSDVANYARIYNLINNNI